MMRFSLQKMIITLFMIVTVVIFVIVILPWLLVSLSAIWAPNPPTPEFTYGEFPFKLEYETNGKRVVVEDKVICKFTGVSWNEGVGKYNKWESYIASTGDESLLLLKIDDSLSLYCSVGGEKYYMGEEIPVDPFRPTAYIVKKDGRFTSSRWLSDNELFENYRIKIIDWELSAPILSDGL